MNQFKLFVYDINQYRRARLEDFEGFYLPLVSTTENGKMFWCLHDPSIEPILTLIANFDTVTIQKDDIYLTRM